FGCLDAADSQILVTPSRADRVIALGRVLARNSNRVRELSEEDRLSLLRLTEQVSQIAQKLEHITQQGEGETASPFRFDARINGGAQADTSLDP
ncbi:hypothetical protein ACI4B7_26530, partial [Klebsiella pneumoniae]|uniref:hypothetical protein n=1 Tax=Klebsiella pneumoniae TaxID=573 RepID=UPI003853D9DD